MTLQDLEALLALARGGSIQAAAKASGVPRTTLRRRLDRLEASVGAPVATTGPSGVTLTQAGRFLVAQAPSMIKRRASLLTRAQRLGHHSANQLRVLLTTGLPPMFVARVAARLSALAPDLRFDLSHAARPLDRLDEDFDVVVHMGDPPPPRDGYSRVAMRHPRRLMASTAYLERHGAPLTVEALSRHTLIGLADEPPAWPLLDGGAVHIQPDHVVDDFYVLGCMAGAGLGIAYMPRSGAGLAAEVEAVVPVLEDQIGGEVVFRIFMPMRAITGGAPRTFIDLALSLFRDDMPQ